MSTARWALIEAGTVAAVVEQPVAPTIGGTWVESTGQPVGPGHTWAGGQFAAPIAPPILRLTKLEFLGRFPDGVFVRLLELARTEAGIEAFMKQIDWATPDPDGTSVSVADPRVIAGVAQLVAGGIVTAAQASAILSAK